MSLKISHQEMRLTSWSKVSNTIKQYSVDEKITSVLTGLCGMMSIVALCCRDGISKSMYSYRSKELHESGKIWEELYGG